MSIDSPGIAQAWVEAGNQGPHHAPATSARRGWPLAFVFLLALAVSGACGAEDTASPQGTTAGTFHSLDSEVQALKQEALDLNRDLFLLEEELLYPANTQLAIFVSMDVGTFFALDSVRILLDGKEVSNYLYTQREEEALLRGGVQRIWLGNLKTGRHELTAFFTGKGPHDRDYQRGASLRIDKGVGAKYVELKISDRAQQLQPEFVVKEWE
jgi:hypothetical protein